MLPSVAPQLVGLVVVPKAMTGAVGAAFTTMFADAAEVQPVAVSLTVKLCVVAAARPDNVVLVPEPAIAPGLMVQLPAGKPLKSTLPVGVVQVGWVIVPTVGALGAPGSLRDTGPARMLD